jgi:hypothetical protein
VNALVRPDSYAMADISAKLRAWGYLCERVRLSNAYPDCDTTYRARMGGGENARLPIPDIPSWAVQMSMRVRRLPDDEGNAVTLWYCYQLRPGQKLLPGQSPWWPTEEKAIVLGVSEWELRRRVREGKYILITQETMDTTNAI